MKSTTQTITVFSKRLKQARKAEGITQEKLGTLAGIDEFSASARVNQYERAVHEPDYGTAARLAAALNIPVSYLFEPDDKLAELLLAVSKLTVKDRNKVAAFIQSIGD